MVVLPTEISDVSSQCAYCPAPSVDAVVTIWDLEIRHCVNHKAEASRDVRAWLHDNDIVALSDAVQHPLLYQFLRLFDTGVCRNVRYRGPNKKKYMDVGWRVHYDEKEICPGGYIQKGCYGWYIDAVKPDENGCDLTEDSGGTLQFTYLVKPEVAAMNSPEILELLPYVEDLLDEGIYKTEYEEHASLIQENF